VRLLTFINTWLIGLQLFAQPILIAEADRYKLGLGEEVRVSFTFQEQGEKFEAPNLGSDWALLSGPNRSYQTSIINGRVKQQQKFDFLLRPRKKGTLTLKPARIKHNGKWIESKALQFEISEASAVPQNSNDPRAIAAKNSFIKIRTSKKKVFVGEPVILEYVLYYNDAEMPIQEEELSFQGFYKQDLEIDESQRKGREVIDGRNYQTYIFKRILLIAQLSTAKIEGQSLVVVPTYIPSNRRDVFGRRQMQLIRQRTFLEAPALTVSPLPERNRPESFTGAVGQFEFNADLTPPEVQADGSVTLSMKLSGAGNLGLIDIPEPKFPVEFEVFDPEERQSIRTGKFGQKGRLSKEYLLIPRYRGTYKIPPLRFSFFNPASEEYVEIVRGPMEVKVTGGQEAPNSAQALAGSLVTAGGGSKQAVTLLEEDIRFIHLGNVRWRLRGAGGSGAWWILLIIPILLAGAFQLYLMRRQNQEKNSAEIRASKAFRKAQKEVRAMKKDGNGDHSEKLNEILESYFFEKLRISRSEMNEERWVKLLREHQVEDGLIERLTKLYRRLLGSRFAPGGDSSEAQSEELLAVLKDLEKQWA
jgi:hypothetical protein